MIPVKRKCLLHLPHDGKMEYPLATCTDDTSRQRQCVLTQEAFCMCLNACVRVVPVKRAVRLSRSKYNNYSTSPLLQTIDARLPATPRLGPRPRTQGKAGPCKNVGSAAEWQAGRALDASRVPVLCLSWPGQKGVMACAGMARFTPAGRRTRRPCCIRLLATASSTEI